MLKKLSIIIPIHNEEKNLEELFINLVGVLNNLEYDYEIIAIDDGSQDGSLKELKHIANLNHKVKIISFLTNAGQTAAISAGIMYSIGDVIVPIDGDLENDPNDIPRLLDKLDEGYDMVSGWRKNRWEESYFIRVYRKAPSIMANWLISKITKVTLHDYGCTLKAYRREVIRDIHLYGEMHRFIPIYIALRGVKSTEIKVNYFSRKYGKSHYGMSRIFKVSLDLLTVTFLSHYFTRPIHFFGKFGFFMLFFGVLSGGCAVYLRLFKDMAFISTPLPTLTAILIIVGFQFILMGILAEVIIRTYFEVQEKPTFLIREKINFD